MPARVALQIYKLDHTVIRRFAIAEGETIIGAIHEITRRIVRKHPEVKFPKTWRKMKGEAEEKRRRSPLPHRWKSGMRIIKEIMRKDVDGRTIGEPWRKSNQKGNNNDQEMKT